MKFLIYLTIVINLSTITFGSDQFGEIFTGLQEEESTETKPGDDLYVCIRQYVTHSNLTVHEITENPKKINMFTVDCKAIIKRSIEDAANAMASDKYLSEQQKDCVKSEFKKHKFFDDMAVAIALRQSNLNANQMIKEKQKFIERMRIMTETLNTCVLPKKKEKKQVVEEKKENVEEKKE